MERALPQGLRVVAELLARHPLLPLRRGMLALWKPLSTAEAR